MESVYLSGIEIKENNIFYRREYFADVIYKYKGSIKKNKIKFIIEIDPLGNKYITIDFIDSINYPVLKLMISIKKLIIDLEYKGKLP